MNMKIYLQILLLISILSYIVIGQQNPNETLEQSYYNRCGNTKCLYTDKCCDAVFTHWCCALGNDAVCCGSYCCSKGSRCGEGNCKYQNMELYLGAVNPEEDAQDEREEQEKY